MKYDIKYIFRRVLTFFIIFVILSFFKSCEVHAETYPLTTDSVSFNLWTSTGGYVPTGTTDKVYTNNSATSYYGFTQKVILEGLLPDSSPNILFPGQYLIEFYVYSTNSTINSNPTCSDYSSNFTNINITTGNWVSNEIDSQCVDSYNTTYNGKPAVRLLYKFTYKGANTGADGIDTIRFNVTSTPNDWFSSGYYGFTYGLSSSNIYDYDSSIISEFNNFKQNQTIIAQNGVIISALDGVIARQNQAHTDSQNTQNAINNASSQAHTDSQNTQNAINNQTNTITNSTTTSSENQLSGIFSNNAFNDSSGIQNIIELPLNFIRGLGTTCQPISLTIPYINSNVNLPCIKQELTNRVPTIVNILSITINGFIVYRLLIEIVSLIKSARNPEDDRLEVLDL